MATRFALKSFNGPDDPLVELTDNHRQAVYLRHYLADQDAQTVLIEPAYFDRDFLSEFAAFYGVSSRGYTNRCTRCHYFDVAVTRDQLRAAAGGSVRAQRRLQEAYLGFVVLRPIPHARLGRTVMKWYPERLPATPRIVDPWRWYEAHVAGVTLRVRGLAWQQQDTGVGACATTALWSMLHSSAFDDHHAIPTTADITRFAHRTASLGDRMFPSNGLNIFQVCEAIKGAGLAPVVLQGDPPPGAAEVTFSPERFRSACASLIRSGYPVLLLGRLENYGRHAVCAVGFRDAAPQAPSSGAVELQDASVPHLYIHDDNIGPGVRFEVRTDPAGHVILTPSAPPPRNMLQLPPNPTATYPTIIPSQLVAAVHEDLRTSPDRLHRTALGVATAVKNAYAQLVATGILVGPPAGLTVSTRFFKLHRYVGEELDRLLAHNPRMLSQVRLTLAELVSPMSLHLGVVRIGSQSVPLVDVLYDTTDGGTNLWPFASVQFDPLYGTLVNLLTNNRIAVTGRSVRAW